MGGFFTNIQIFVGSSLPQDMLNETIRALQQHVTAEGFQEVVPDEPADRTLFVSPPGDSWLSVYDEQTEDQDLEKLTSLARDLSKRLSTFALAILVHDSDVLEMRLCRNGRIVDRYSSNPGYWEGDLGGTRPRGNADRWQDVLSGTTKDLELQWRHEDVFVEDTLKRIAGLLGLDPLACCLGFESLDSLPEADFSKYTRLRFQRLGRARPLVQQGVEIERPPGLASMTVHGGLLECCVGDTLEDDISHGTISAGGSSKGLEIWIRGAAIRDRLITFGQIEVWSGNTKEIVTIVPEHRRDDQTLFVSLPEFQIPAAPPQGSKDFVKVKKETRLPDGRVTTMSYETSSKEFDAARVGVRARGIAEREGSGTLEIALVPSTNPGDGRSIKPMEIEVFPAPRRPLKSLPPTPAISRSLRHMEEPRALSALVALGADRETSVSVAMEAMARWHEVIADGRAIEYQTVFSPARGKFRSGKLKAADIPSGRRWRQLGKDLSNFVSFTALHGETVTTTGYKMGRMSSGFNFEADSIFLQNAPSEQLVFVGFWLNLESLTPERIRAADVMLVEIIDRTVEIGGGIQAFLARWDWYPENIEYIPYEVACGIHGQHARSRTWCTRYILGVTDRIWLGSEILGHLGDSPDLVSIAEVRGVGSATRVSLREGQSLDDLEKGVTKLLPDATTWRVESDRMHAILYPGKGMGP